MTAKVDNMSDDAEMNRLTKENDNFKKIIETQQNTINRMIDYFILGIHNTKLQK
ncbi:MAG: adenylate kinase [Roseburia sp.]|nr:adenylate kinase [Roseburia sp.]